MQKEKSFWNFIGWFDPRGKKPGTWGFILNRITGIGLVVYLALHLFMLGKLAQGPEAYNDFIALAKTPAVMFGELLVVAAGILHGLNGIRIGLNSFGVAVPQQRMWLYAIGCFSAIGVFFFAWKMLTG